MALPNITMHHVQFYREIFLLLIKEKRLMMWNNLINHNRDNLNRRFNYPGNVEYL